MMKPLRVGDDVDAVTYACLHWRNFPAAFAGTANAPEDLLDRKVLDGAGYQRYKVWEKECGIVRMDESKCLKCPHIRKLVIVPHQVPKMVKIDGSDEWTPAIDIPSLEAFGKYRRAKRR